MRRRGWILQGAHLFAFLATASATAIPPSQIFSRQDSTCPKDYSSCANFPGNFCCPTTQACISLAGGTTLLCCPQKSDCQRIVPISCDISLQDASKKPEAVVKTTALTSQLPKCGDRCCPFGYSCGSGKDECVKDKEQKAPPGASTSTTTSASASASATATSASSQTSIPAATTTSSDSGGGPSGAVIGGVVGGILAAIALAVIAACILIKRKKKAAGTPSLKLSRSSSSFGNIISNPIVMEGNLKAMRSDFNRRASRSFDGSTLDGFAPTRKSISSRGSNSSRTRNLTGNGLLRHSSIAYGYNPADLPNPPPPRTPRQGDREPSSVSINVFADPLTLTPESAAHAARGKRNSGMTTFTQLMDEADLGGVARGQAYVPYRPQTAGDGSPVRR
ncbi:hypothetical protein B0T14DRAFT_541736 [Immersiella caudata]|uniref:Uncharacterized protein n=1 Tax=Immersiella caudata TaxID=314043 RepID=A0AA40CBN7_9PEZI|nr:hypothetical protein B0T14DRAFT_541736 [Immersiella caudata]